MCSHRLPEARLLDRSRDIAVGDDNRAGLLVHPFLRLIAMHGKLFFASCHFLPTRAKPNLLAASNARKLGLLRK